jgi:hypothetical protein
VGASNSNNKNMKFYALKAKANETDTPHFQLTEKIDGEYKKTESFDTMSGCIKSALIEEFEWQGVKSKNFCIYFEDDNETSKVTFPHSKVTYSILNSIASDTASINDYSITVNKKQDKTTKKWWGAAAIKVNGQRSEWAIDPKTAPRSEPILGKDGKPVMKQGMPLYDDEPVKEFWEKFFTERIMPAFKHNAEKPKAETTAPTTNAEFLDEMNNSDEADF